MKKKPYIIIFITIIIAIFGVNFFIFYNLNNSFKKIKSDDEMVMPEKIPSYHFVMISGNQDNFSWESIKEGGKRAAKEFGVAVEFKGSNIYNPEEQSKYMDMAIASKVDGIATYVWDEAQGKNYIDKAVKQGIPVITMGTDAKNSGRTAFVGINTYDSGVQLGRLTVEATGNQGEVVVLMSDGIIGGIMAQNLLLSGIQEAVKDYPNIKIKPIEYNTSEHQGIEEAIKDIISSNPSLDTIVCTTARDTSIVAEILVDLNKVGYHIIGSGDSPEVLRYIERGLVFGSVKADLEQMGYNAIEALVDTKKIGRTSTYFKVDNYSITKNNINDFIKDGKK
jgi:ribose transport system substrate-binding protein